MSCVKESELQNASPMNYLSVPGEKVNINFMCVVPLMVAIDLLST